MNNLRFIALAGVFAFAPAVFAQVVFTNFGPGLTYDMTGGWNVTGPGAGGYQEIAAPFTPSSSGVLSSADVALGYVTPTSTFTLSIYSDNAGSPGVVLGSSAVTTAAFFFGNPISCVMNVSMPAVALAAGTQYWLDAATDGSNYNAWDMALTATGFDSRGSATGSWNSAPNSAQPAFDINIGAVPEPGSAFGLLAGGAGLLLLRRRK